MATVGDLDAATRAFLIAYHPINPYTDGILSDAAADADKYPNVANAVFVRHIKALNKDVNTDITGMPDERDYIDPLEAATGCAYAIQTYPHQRVHTLVTFFIRAVYARVALVPAAGWDLDPSPGTITAHADNILATLQANPQHPGIAPADHALALVIASFAPAAAPGSKSHTIYNIFRALNILIAFGEPLFSFSPFPLNIFSYTAALTLIATNHYDPTCISPFSGPIDTLNLQALTNDKHPVVAVLALLATTVRTHLDARRLELVQFAHSQQNHPVYDLLTQTWIYPMNPPHFV